MTGKCYGWASDPDDIEVEATIKGGDVVPERAVVRITDPKPGNVFALSPDKARAAARRIRDRSDSADCGELADEIEKKAKIAEATEAVEGAGDD